MIPDLLFRLRSLVRRGSMENELDRELRFHIDRETEKLMRAGVEPQEAKRRAQLALGGLEPVKEECRQARGLSGLEAAMQDLRYALRGIRRAPGFAIAAMVTLGVGTAAISTVLTMADTLLFRELPVRQAARLVVVQPTRAHGRRQGWVSYPDYVHFRDRTRTLDGLAAHYSNVPLFVVARDQARELNGAVISANFFPTLGIQPALGRFFRADEDSVPDRARVAVLGYDFWRTWFDGAADTLGAAVKINGTTFSVIGVAPQGFRGLTVQPDEIYIPMMMARAGYRWCADAFAASCNVFDMIGRLAEGRTAEQASAEMTTLLPESWATAKEDENSGVVAAPARGVYHPDIVRSSEVGFVKLLALVAGILLFVCCANLSGLLISRNSARIREFAIRTSLGAGSGRLVGQLIVESLVLAFGGGVLGMLFSFILTGALNSKFYSVDVAGHPLSYDFNPEPVVLLAVLAVSVAAGFLAGLLPALRSLRSGAAGSLKRYGGSVSAGARPGRWLAGAQVGIAVALTANAGLLATSADNMVSGINYEASHVALIRLRPRLVQYPPEKAQSSVRAAVARLEASPGVEAASMVGTGAPLVGSGALVSLPGSDGSQTIRCRWIAIGPRYFETLRTAVLRGREFDARDTSESPPVAIVSEALARRLWPAGRVIGATLTVNLRPHQVIGIVQDVPLQNRGEPAIPYVFTPFWQNPAVVDAYLMMRVRGDPAAALPALVRVVHRADPEVPIAEAIPLAVQMEGSLSSLRITAGFVAYAASLAVLLSAVGLYGALSFSVSRRTKEIGIRMAIGARPREVLGMVIREGMLVVWIGIVLGILGALAGTRIVRHLLYGPGAADVPVYAVSVLAVAFAALIACWVPARRAAAVEPVTALRND